MTENTKILSWETEIYILSPCHTNNIHTTRADKRATTIMQHHRNNYTNFSNDRQLAANISGGLRHITSSTINMNIHYTLRSIKNAPSNF